MTESNPLIALQNDPAVSCVAMTNEGALVAVLEQTPDSYERAGEAIAERVDCVAFDSARKRGQLFFSPRRS